MECGGVAGSPSSSSSISWVSAPCRAAGAWVAAWVGGAGAGARSRVLGLSPVGDTKLIWSASPPFGPAVMACWGEGPPFAVGMERSAMAVNISRSSRFVNLSGSASNRSVSSSRMLVPNVAMR